MEWLRKLHRRLLPDDRSIGWLPYLWLVYLFFFFIRYYFRPPGALETVAIVATMIVFLVLYFRGHWQRGWSLLPVIIGLVALGVAWGPYNVGAGVFFIYAASFAAWIGRPRRGAIAVAAVVATAMLAAWLLQPDPTYWFPPLLFGSLVGTINIYYLEQSRQDAALRLSQEEVGQLARVAERERIARDLHDLLGHTLSVIALKAELAGKLVERDPRRAVEEIREVEQVSRSALAQVRDAVSGFRQRGIAGELENARLALKAAAVDLDVEGEPPELAPADEAVLSLVLRESITNVIRHAHASLCRVLFRPADGGLLLEISDDGRGASGHFGNGVEGMRARLAEVGGRFDILSDHGTRVRAWMPVK